MITELKKLLDGLEYRVLIGENFDTNIKKVTYDSRNVEEGDLFVCIKGANFDSHSMISEVSEKGAKVIVIDINNEYVEGADVCEGTTIIGVSDTRIALAIISKNYFDNPAENMKIIGITGTKGKTTTAFMVKNMLEMDGFKVGMIGTIGVFYDGKHIETDNTTPESFAIYEYFAKMRDAGCNYVVMEVSSQSLKYNRVYGMHFFYAIWTNISPEHIGKNEHEDFHDYLNSKLKILNMCSTIVVNAHTDCFDDVIKVAAKKGVGLLVKNDNIDITLNIPGEYNIENASLAYRFGVSLGIRERIIRKALKETIVPGRCEVVYKNDDMEIVVDFAHEQNGAKEFLTTMKNYIKGTSRRLVVVFGCGGNRAKERRYGMGEVVGQYADFVILTADNSRYEKTIDIIADIESTMSKYKKKDDKENGYVIVESRKDAIEYAIKNHKNGDLICIIGKGHETTNEINGVKTHFSDRETVLELV